MPNTRSLKVWFEGLVVPIEFELYDNPFVEKWSLALSEAIAAQQNFDTCGTFYGRSIHSKAELVDKMNRCIQTLNAKSDDQILLKVDLNCDREFLNQLHKEFERLEPKFAGRNDCQEVFQALVDLNSAIHQCEIHTMVPPHRPSLNFSVDITFQRQTRFELSESDFQYFTADQKWGECYLGYSTIGVPVLNAFRNQDQTRPTPQTRYTADLWICLTGDTEFNEWDSLKKWLKVTHGWDAANPKLAIGYIPLGMVKNLKHSREELFRAVQPHKKIQRVELSFSDSQSPQGD